MITDLLDVQINNYEGPLDLLIHLIHKNEMNIFDVPISEITSQFVNEIKQMQELDMEIAGEFIHMASYLIYLKSRSLLPRADLGDDEISIEEERFNLAQALVELAFAKDLALHLQKLSITAGRYIARDTVIAMPKESIIAPEGSIYKLAESFFNANAEVVEAKVIVRSTKEISDEVFNATRKMILSKKETLWSELTKRYTDGFDKAIAFSTILVLSKQQLIRSIQDGNFTDILMQRLKEDEA